MTLEILNLGITGRNISNGTLNLASGAIPCLNEIYPNSIIRLQRVRDLPIVAGVAASPCCLNRTANVVLSRSPPRSDLVAATHDYCPLPLYDTRWNMRDMPSQNVLRDVTAHHARSQLDVKPQRWLADKSGARTRR